MFYMQPLMNKRGPLAKIWLAAHWDKKLTKAHIFECNLETTIEKILSPKCAIALRTSGHLLLGVVRIYHRKTKYLLADCNEALLKMQAAFRPGLVDLPKENCEANYDAITLPEEFHDFETKLPEVNAIDVAQHFTLNQSRAEDITLMEEDFRLLHSDSFGDETEIPRQGSFLNDSLPTGSGGFLLDHSFLSFSGDKTALNEEASVLKHDGFGDEGAVEDMIDSVLGGEQHSLIELFGPEEEIPLIPKPTTDDIADHSIPDQETRSPQVNETTLFSNEEEGFVLEPIDETGLKRKQRSKRKRKLLVDAVKGLSRNTIANQLMCYKDTVTTLDIAPPTRKLMILQERGGVNKLLERSTQSLIHEHLLMETVEIMSGLSNGSFTDSSVRQQTEMKQTTLEHESEEINTENEEKKRQKRTLLLLDTLRHIDQTAGAKSFSLLALCKENNSKEVASKFYSLLELKKHQAVDMAQAAPYADIIVTKGPMFHTL
nr:double-strand-break repair protein rad21-like protein 1 [Anolis sagrei ordinatus]